MATKEQIIVRMRGLQSQIEEAIDSNSVQSAPDDLISKHFRAPWGIEGEVGDVIIESLEGHLGMHLADLRSADPTAK
jgi:hypothetical protein